MLDKFMRVFVDDLNTYERANLFIFLFISKIIEWKINFLGVFFLNFLIALILHANFHNLLS